MIGKVFDTGGIPEGFTSVKRQVVGAPAERTRREYSPAEAALLAIKRHNHRGSRGWLRGEVNAYERGERSLLGAARDWDPVRRGWRGASRLTYRPQGGR
jgi:hypothetical protein